MDRCRRRPGMTRTAVMNKESKRPEWVIRQGFACVWVQAPNAEGSGETHRGPARAHGWLEGRTGRRPRGVPGEEYREHAKPGDYTRSVILEGRPSPGPLVKTTACGGQGPARSPCGVAPCLNRRTCLTGMPLFSSASELPHELPRHTDDRGGRIWLN